MIILIGIYKIENLINGKIYIGQSIDIERRWKEHCSKNKSLIGKAITKFGQENFSFEILEECEKNSLNKKEIFYIQKFNSLVPNGYNVREDNYNVQSYNIYFYYNKNILLNIISDLKDNILSFSEIAKKYNLNISTISRINKGDVHVQENISYPIRGKNYKKAKKCLLCGAEIQDVSTYCQNCYSKLRSEHIPNREELKNLIREKPFTQIGKQFNVSDNTIRKWCKKYNLPYRKTDIKAISSEKWNTI